MKWYRRWRNRRAFKRIKRLYKYPNAQAIWAFMHDPSEREIGRALGISKTTVHDNLAILRKHNLNRGEWVL